MFSGPHNLSLHLAEHNEGDVRNRWNSPLWWERWSGSAEPAVIGRGCDSRLFELLVQVNPQHLEDVQWVWSCCNMSGWEVWPLSHHLSHSTEGTEHAKLILDASRQPWCLSSRSNNMSLVCTEARVVTDPTLQQSVPIPVKFSKISVPISLPEQKMLN